jgi:hypothetical protein
MAFRHHETEFRSVKIRFLKLNPEIVLKKELIFYKNTN